MGKNRDLFEAIIISNDMDDLLHEKIRLLLFLSENNFKKGI